MTAIAQVIMVEGKEKVKNASLTAARFSEVVGCVDRTLIAIVHLKKFSHS